MWHRVFGANQAQVELDPFLQKWNAWSVDYHRDDQGWYRAEIRLSETAPPLIVDRYLAKEEGIRAELNTWAAWLEIHAPDPEPLMQRMIGASQIFAFQTSGDDFVRALCQFLAQETDGLWQVDGFGFFDGQSNLVIAEVAENEEGRTNNEE